MKQNLKNYLKLGILLFGIALILVNCQQDDLIQKNPIANSVKQKSYTVRPISRQEISKNNKIDQVLKHIEKEKVYRGALNKSTDTVAGHEIYTNYSKYVESEDGLYHSYTFPAKDLNYPELLKNLVISLQPDGSYKEMFITYDLTEEEIELINQGYQIDFSGKVYYDDGFCFDVVAGETKCCFNVHTYQMIQDGQTCQCSATGQPVAPEDVVINIVPCFDDTGGSGDPFDTDNDSSDETDTNTEGTYDPTGPEGGSGTNSGDATSIITCKGHDCPDEFDPIHEDNCEELNRISTLPSLQDEFNTLENSLGYTYEKGYALTATVNTPHVNPQSKDGESGCKPINMPRGVQVFGFMHTHPTGCGSNGTHAMFGHGDVYSLYKYSQGFNPSFPYDWDTSLFVVYMTVGNNHYAIKINDINKLAKINDIFSDYNKRKRFKNKLSNAYSKSGGNSNNTGTQNQLAKAFLKVVNKAPYDLGISLYRSSHDDISTNGSNWTRLKLDSNNNLDDTQNCN